MVNAQMANAYKNQQVMTSSPEQLTLLLYNGALRFLTESILAMEQGNIQKSHNANMRVQDIVREFVITLDMSYEISKNWAQLYEYTEYCLIPRQHQKRCESFDAGEKCVRRTAGMLG